MGDMRRAARGGRGGVDGALRACDGRERDVTSRDGRVSVAVSTGAAAAAEPDGRRCALSTLAAPVSAVGLWPPAPMVDVVVFAAVPTSSGEARAAMAELVVMSATQTLATVTSVPLTSMPVASAAALSVADGRWGLYSSC